MHKIDTTQMSPFTIHELKIFAPARVNGRDTLAQLDTAATFATVSPTVADGLTREGKVTVRSAFGDRDFEMVSVDIEFIGLTLSKVRARVHKDDGVLPFEADIVLSGQELFGQGVIYDFRLLGCLPCNKIEGTGWEEVTAEFLENGLCIIEMEAGGKAVNALFDTGAGISVINSARIKENDLQTKAGYKMVVRDATGVQHMQVIHSYSGLRMGEIEIPPFDGIAVNLSKVEEAVQRRIDLVFGANAMLKSGLRWWFHKQEGEVFVLA
ncbi:MAG: hypothetical protein D6732_03895 [Methanobacteriota archaeon]|nr:MAG: hypothetical protein D6732_03895 [Euryarchaeota archaeon]